MVFFSQARARAWFQARHLSSMGAASRIRSAAAGWRVGKHASKGTAGVFAVAGGITGLQWAYGTGADFFDNRFVTTSSTAANDIADFYGCEDFMQVRLDPVGIACDCVRNDCHHMHTSSPDSPVCITQHRFSASFRLSSIL